MLRIIGSDIKSATERLLAGELDTSRRFLKRSFFTALIVTGLLLAYAQLFGPSPLLGYVWIGVLSLPLVAFGFWVANRLLPNRIEASPAKMVWWFAAALALDLCLEISETASSVLWRDAQGLAITYLTMYSVAFLITLVACLWWYLRSKLLGRRSPISQSLGFLLFALGSIAPIGAVRMALRGSVSTVTHSVTSDTTSLTLFRSGILLFAGIVPIGAAMIAIGDRLAFRRAKQG